MSGFFEDHLNLDAIVAFVDGELSAIAYQRAAAHLVRCGYCSTHVAEQASARESLRSASIPRMPGSLAATLASIPIAAPISADGIRVEMKSDPEPNQRTSRFRRLLSTNAQVAQPDVDSTGHRLPQR